MLGQLQQVEGARRFTADLLGYLGRCALCPQQVLKLVADRWTHMEVALFQDASRYLRQLIVRHLAQTQGNPFTPGPGFLQDRRHA